MRTLSRRLRRTLIVAACGALMATCGSAQDITDLVAIPLLGRQVKDIIADFQNVANRLLQDGQMAADGVVAKAGEQMNVEIQNMGLILSAQQKQFFENLDASERGVLGQMNDIITSMNNLSSTVSTTAELANLDILNVLNSIPFLSHMDFYVSSVHGLTMASNTTIHQLTVTGLGFGQDTSNQKYVITASIQGQILSPDKIIANQSSQVTIMIPDGVLSPLFKDSDLNIVPLQFTSVISKHHAIGGFKPEKPITVTFHLMLLPKHAGTLILHMDVPTGILQPDPNIPVATIPTIQASFTAGTCSPASPCVMQGSRDVSNNQSIIPSTVTFKCTGSSSACQSCPDLHLDIRLQCNQDHLAPCKAQAGPEPASGFLRPSWEQRVSNCINTNCANLEFSNDFNITNAGTHIDVYRSCTGPATVFLEYGASYQTMVATTKPIEQNVVLEWNQDTVIPLPTQFFSANGMILVTNQQFQFDQDSGTTSPTVVKVVSVSQTDDPQKWLATFRLVTPVLN